MRKAFTLLELLVVIAIIAVLMGLLLPAVQKIRESSYKIKCINNVKQLTLGLTTFENVNGCYPPGLGALGDQRFQRPNMFFERRMPYPSNLRFGSWYMWILPYIEQDNLFKNAPQTFALNGNVPGIYSGNFFANYHGPEIFMCPSDPRTKKQWNTGQPNGWYAGVAGTSIPNWLSIYGLHRADGILYWRSKTLVSQITDGTSNTAILGEHPPDPSLYWGWWNDYIWVFSEGSLYSQFWEGDTCMGVAQEGGVDYSTFNGYNGGPPCEFVSTLGSPNIDISANKNYQAIYSKPGPKSYFHNSGTPSNYCDHNRFWSHHLSGAIWGFADGSVRFISYNVNGYVITSIGTKAGHKFIQEPQLLD